MKIAKKVVWVLLLALMEVVILSGCGTPITPTPDLQGTIEAAATATLVSQAAPDVAATAEAAVAAALASQPASDATATYAAIATEIAVAQAVQEKPTATPTPVPPTATPEPTDTPTVGPTYTSAPVDTPTATPIPTDTSTPTDTPTPMLALRVIPPDPAICGSCPPGVPPGDCCLTITIQWENIEPSDGRIYLLATVGGDKWWIPGTAILPTQQTGQGYITDGSYSKPRLLVTLFACLTSETYPPGQGFDGRPTSCTLSSPDVLMQTQ